MNPSLYDLLDVDPTASDAEIRAAWKAAIADLDPTDRRFRAYNQAAEVLLDPGKRAAYDADLAAAEPEAEPEPAVVTKTSAADPQPSVIAEVGASKTPRKPEPDPTGTPRDAAADTSGWTVPTWLLLAVAVALVALVAVTAWVWSLPSDTAVETSTRSAQSAAENAAVAILSYDAETLEQDQESAQSFMTSDYRKDYDELFEVIKQNAPSTGTKVEAEVIASGVVRSGEDRVAILLFVNRPTTNKQQAEPVIYKDQVTVTMELVGDEWLVDDMETSPVTR
jgi:Mce-associated membrane protein